VFDESGQPLNGIEVEMSWVGADSHAEFPRTITGKDPFKPAGYYEFIHTPGEFRLRITQGDWESDVADGLRTVAVPGREGDTVTYEVNFRLAGVGLPTTGCTVEGHAPGLGPGRRVAIRCGEQVWEGETNAMNRFAASDLAPGTYDLEIEGFGVVASDVVLAEGERFILEFPARAGMIGRAAGQGLPELAHLRSGRWDWHQEARLSPEGSFRFEGLPPGSYSLELGGTTLQDLWVLGHGVHTLPALELGRPEYSSIRGRVVDSQGAPVPGVIVWLQLDGTPTVGTTSASDGTFHFDELPEAIYVVLMPEYDVSLTVTLDGVRDAGLEDVVLPDRGPEKVIDHLLLFGRGSNPATRTNLLLAFDALRRCGASGGFDLAVASRANRVTIVGDSSNVSTVDEESVREAHCEVERLDGDSFEVERLLTRLI
jgi:hypothetical protein